MIYDQEPCDKYTNADGAKAEVKSFERRLESEDNVVVTRRKIDSAHNVVAAKHGDFLVVHVSVPAWVGAVVEQQDGRRLGVSGHTDALGLIVINGDGSRIGFCVG